MSVSNYWEFKNNFQVIILCSVRTIKGSIVSRQEYTFEETNVLNIPIKNIQEGSIEIEAFSNANLRIPYAAVMAIYETNCSVSMVHSYSRNHSLIELEDKKSITEGGELLDCGCNKSIKNVAIFHNGHHDVSSQTAKLILTNIKGKDKVVEFCIPDLLPFEL